MEDEEDFLLISGIQHFCFCRRQWALIHIEKQWAENLYTVEGQQLHEKAHDGLSSERKGELIISRGMPVLSRSLGATGVCDIVEFQPRSTGIPLEGREGLYQPVPVEYKRGSPKESLADVLQLCAQALCLEEMLLTEVPLGYLYYGETKHRLPVEITDQLRSEVRDMFVEMRQYYERRYSPRVKPNKSCQACSLKDICLPVLGRGKSAQAYISRRIEESSDEKTT